MACVVVCIYNRSVCVCIVSKGSKNKKQNENGKHEVG